MKISLSAARESAEELRHDILEQNQLVASLKEQLDVSSQEQEKWSTEQARQENELERSILECSRIRTQAVADVKVVAEELEAGRDRCLLLEQQRSTVIEELRMLQEQLKASNAHEEQLREQMEQSQKAAKIEGTKTRAEANKQRRCVEQKLEVASAEQIRLQKELEAATKHMKQEGKVRALSNDLVIHSRCMFFTAWQARAKAQQQVRSLQQQLEDAELKLSEFESQISKGETENKRAIHEVMCCCRRLV